MRRERTTFAILDAGRGNAAFAEHELTPSIAEQFFGELMEHTGTFVLNASTANAGCVDEHAFGNDASFPFGSLKADRGSEARRFLFSAAHHGKRQEASLGTFPGKFAWIAVVLFVLSVLIALVG